MELVYGVRVRRVVGEACVGYDVLACVVAFGGTVPEKKATVQGCSQDVSRLFPIKNRVVFGKKKHTYGRGLMATIGCFADLHTVAEFI
jgi:hypothetical protein